MFEKILGGTSVKTNSILLVITVLVSVHCQKLKVGFLPIHFEVHILVEQNPMKQLGLQIPLELQCVFSIQLKSSKEMVSNS